MSFENLLKKAMRLLMSKKKSASLVQVEKESQRVEDLIKKCDYKTHISFTQNHLVPPPLIPIYQPPSFEATTFVQMNGADY